MTGPLDEVFRREAGRCTATLIRVLGDIGLAEDAVAEAFAIAAEQWPKTGVPPNPGGWITTTARNRAIDWLRRESTRSQRHLAAHRLHTGSMEPDHDPELNRLDDFGDAVADDQLRLMFLCAHPALAADAQVGLILRLLAGLSMDEIASESRRAARTPAAGSTDWSQVIALYDQLHALRPNPVTTLNRSVAVAELHGPVAGLNALAEINPASLEDYQPYHATRADLLARAGRHDEATAAYDRAIELATNTIERDFLIRQRATL